MNKIVAILFDVSALIILTVSMVGGVGSIAVASSRKPPKYDHVVVVIMENHSFGQISQAGTAIYLKTLAKEGALFTNSYGVAHPSQPNYLALFSGSTQAVKDDGKHDFTSPNLATRLRGRGKTFVGYVETGSPRKHNPWESFAGARKFEQPLSDFPSNYAKLPAVSFVIPNLADDMHDGTIKQGDVWLETNLAAYANWSKRNNSLMIVTFDEDDSRSDNHIFTVFYGYGVQPGRYSEKIDHYAVLRAIEDIETISPLGASAAGEVTSRVWTRR